MGDEIERRKNEAEVAKVQYEKERAGMNEKAEGMKKRWNEAQDENMR